MPSVIIDSQKVNVPAGDTILDATRKIGTEIPTMCHLEGYPSFTSCMVCMVEDLSRGVLLPACSTLAVDGMRISTNSERALTSRRQALELMLSEHVGDCDAPCFRVCPAKIDIPRMLRMLGESRFEEAAKVVRESVGQAEDSPCMDCNGRCEKACRRAQHDAAVSIKMLVAFALRQVATSAADSEADAGAQRFNCNMGKITEREMQTFLKHASARDRITPALGEDAGFAEDEAVAESLRCLHCDCRKRNACRLRDYATEYDAHQRRYAYARRKEYVIVRQGGGVIYEPEKCVKCGICVRITERGREPLGLAFIGRGFDVRVGVPFDKELSKALLETAAKCVEACPTAALAFDDLPNLD